MNRTVLRIVLSLLFLLSSTAPAWAEGDEHVILRSTGTREQMRRAIEALGGKVTQEYRNVNAIAATVPAGAMAALAAFPEFKVAKDLLVAPPSPHRPAGGAGGMVTLGKAQAVLPEATSGSGGVSLGGSVSSDSLIRADVVRAAGVVGDGAVVVIIDTGTANAPSVDSIHGRVMGGESLVPPDMDSLSATSTRNSPHGTWVGSAVVGRSTPGFAEDSCVSRAVRRFAPRSSWFDGAEVGVPGFTFIPLRGVAQGPSLQGARLYPLKIFRADGGNTATSLIFAAMDRVITLKRNFLAGIPSVPVSGDGSEDNPHVFESLDVSVVNMSLGKGTLAPGLDLDDQLVRQFLEVGIVPVIAAGNSGPSSLTTGSPSTALGAIATAAATAPAHARIIASLYYSTDCDLDFGAAFWPSEHLQTSSFSSRGPTADGRAGISVMTVGYGILGQGPDGTYDFVSGTSITAPQVAGAAALLRSGVPGATAIQIRNAIESGANPRMLGDHSGPFDQGAGFLDVARSLEFLRAGKVSNSIRTPQGKDEVAKNLEKLGLQVRALGAGASFAGRTGALDPGQRREYLVEVDKDVGALRIDVRNLSVAPPAQQNQVYGDDVVLFVHSAMTSALTDYRLFEYVLGDASYTVGNLFDGVMRITFVGDETN
ncbi:MAG: Serine protease AprX, partial [Pseudomonadota bacterium]